MNTVPGSGKMKLQIQQWSDRSRTLVLMLAVIVPAIALIGFGLHHLWSIQRDNAIEAAIQWDYLHFLAIAEKQIDARAYDVAEEDIAKFPSADSPEELDAFLDSHPDIAHAFLWSGKNNY